jgi:hypothetical protein
MCYNSCGGVDTQETEVELYQWFVVDQWKQPFIYVVKMYIRTQEEVAKDVSCICPLV